MVQLSGRQRKIWIPQENNQNLKFSFPSWISLSYSGKITVAIKRKHNSVMLLATSLILQTRYDISINPIQEVAM